MQSEGDVIVRVGPWSDGQVDGFAFDDAASNVLELEQLILAGNVATLSTHL